MQHNATNQSVNCQVLAYQIFDYNGFETHLTKREAEVLYLIAYESTMHEIADQLHISFYTVNSHRKSMIQKLKVKNTAGLIRRAFELGLLQMQTN